MTPTTDKTVLRTVTVVRFPFDESGPFRLSGEGVMLGDAVAFAELPETPELGPGVFPPVAAGAVLDCTIEVTVTVALCWTPKLPEGSRSWLDNESSPPRDKGCRSKVDMGGCSKRCSSWKDPDSLIMIASLGRKPLIVIPQILSTTAMTDREHLMRICVASILPEKVRHNTS
jgi:hypothetical protein